eukprot:2855428-Pleurochrysis_carterae.AAC.6
MSLYVVLLRGDDRRLNTLVFILSARPMQSLPSHALFPIQIAAVCLWKRGRELYARVPIRHNTPPYSFSIVCALEMTTFSFDGRPCISTQNFGDCLFLTPIEERSWKIIAAHHDDHAHLTIIFAVASMTAFGSDTACITNALTLTKVKLLAANKTLVAGQVAVETSHIQIQLRRKAVRCNKSSSADDSAEQKA